MLVQFRLKNFMSFRDEQVFSMVAANGLREKNSDLAENVIEATDQLNLLKSAVVYGANASGKSNLLRAITFYARAMTEASPEGKAVPRYSPFLLDKQLASEPSLLEAVFVTKNTHYRYGFEINDQLVVAEWLYVIGKKESNVFYRSNNEFKIGRSYPKLKELHNKKMINSASLLVNLGALFNDESCLEVKKIISQIRYSPSLDELVSDSYSYMRKSFFGKTDEFLLQPENKDRVLQLLRVADLGIDDIELIEGEKTLLNDLLNKGKPEYIVSTARRVWNVESNSFQKLSTPLMNFESEGTQKFFDVIGVILAVLDEGKTLVADELDAKLHPLLTQRIVQMFNSLATNPNNAQLIFATHDTNLLSASLFRRDQIWFTEKDLKGGTQLYALTDYKPDGKGVRNDEQLEKNYIAGKYGGIPYLNNFDTLFEPETSFSQDGANE